jgi:hypothetical protein
MTSTAAVAEVLVAEGGAGIALPVTEAINWKKVQ